MNAHKLKVFLVDDDPAVRDSLSLLLESEGYAVKAYASANDFLAACGPTLRGCILADLHMPGMDGLQLQAEMVRRGSLLPIVFLTGYGDIPTSVKAIKAGAVDFLTKPVTGTRLLQAIEAALASAEQKQEDADRLMDNANRLGSLTEREQAVLKLAAQGLSNKEIARQLGISHRTVEIHKARIMQKTGARNAVDLALLCRETSHLQ